MVYLNIKISKHAKDLIQKYASGLFRNASLEFYGVKTAKIKELISAELPAVEVVGSSADFVFLLEDDTYLHFEFQSTYNIKDLVRFARYDIRLYERDGRKVITVIIYTADVKHIEDDMNFGSLVYRPIRVMMKDFDGNAIYSELTAKIEKGQEITDTDMLNLIFLPLMRNTIDKGELAVRSVHLAQAIPDTAKRNACIASAFAFASKYLNEVDMEKLKGALRMFDKAATILTEMVEEELEEKVGEKMAAMAKKMLKGGMNISAVCNYTELDESTVRKLQMELNEAV